MRPARQDYFIAAIGLAPGVLAYVFRDAIGACFGITPKLVVGLAMVIGIALILAIVVVRVRRLHFNQSSARPWVRLAALAILAMGVTYFFMREEIAAAMGVRVRAGDGIAVFLFVVAAVWLAGQMPQASIDDADKDERLS